ncbi:MFS transporter [Reinekea sp.]|jgi:fucose permease|uniref:MFS transporter n=1 Tax=Reinekea sp. TaxID=1970455 RepID=UPI00398A2764
MNKAYIGLIFLAFIAFSSLGLPDGLLGVAWPSIRSDFNQPLEASGWLMMFGTCGAALSGLFSAKLSRRLGMGKLLSACAGLTGLGLLGYTLAPSFIWFYICALVIGLSAGITDSTVNGFVAKHYSDRLMQWLHASFGLGITVGPLIMTAVLVSQKPWQLGYQISSGIQWLLVMVFLVTASLWVTGVKKTNQDGDVSSHAADQFMTTMNESIKTPSILLSIALFFLYCGLEVSVGLWVFSLLTEAREFNTGLAGTLVSVYWGMFTLGRIFVGIIANKVSNHRIIIVAIGLALVSVTLFALTRNTWTAIIAIAGIGLAFAPLYPSMVSDSMNRVGAKHFNNAMGLQVTGASLGMAFIPAGVGIIAAQTSLNTLPWVLLVILGLFTLVYLSSRRVSR